MLHLPTEKNNIFVGGGGGHTPTLPSPLATALHMNLCTVLCDQTVLTRLDQGYNGGGYDDVGVPYKHSIIVIAIIVTLRVVKHSMVPRQYVAGDH